MILHIFGVRLLAQDFNASFSKHAGFAEALLMHAPHTFMQIIASLLYLRRTERAANNVDKHLRRLQVRSGAR